MHAMEGFFARCGHISHTISWALAGDDCFSGELDERLIVLSQKSLKSRVRKLLNDPGPTCGPQEFSINERGRAFIDSDVQVFL